MKLLYSFGCRRLRGKSVLNAAILIKSLVVSTGNHRRRLIVKQTGVIFFLGQIQGSVVRVTVCTQLYKGFPWFIGWVWQIMFDYTTVSNGDSGQSGLKLQLFPMETIVTSNLIGQNNFWNQWKCFIQLGADRSDFDHFKIWLIWSLSMNLISD